MLIAISGAQGSGKSSVCAALSSMGYSVTQRKTSRSILSDWNVTLDEINDNPALSMQFQDEILSRKIADEQESTLSDGSVYFTERTYMDLFVYTLINLGKFNEHSDWLDSYYMRCVQAQNAYAKVFYLPSGLFAVQHDGVRGSNTEYSHLVDLVLQDYTQRSVPPSKFHTVAHVAVEDRVNEIISHLPSVQN